MNAWEGKRFCWFYPIICQPWITRVIVLWLMCSCKRLNCVVCEKRWMEGRLVNQHAEQEVWMWFQGPFKQLATASVFIVLCTEYVQMFFFPPPTSLGDWCTHSFCFDRQCNTEWQQMSYIPPWDSFMQVSGNFHSWYDDIMQLNAEFQTTVCPILFSDLFSLLHRLPNRRKKTCMQYVKHRFIGRYGRTHPSQS